MREFKVGDRVMFKNTQFIKEALDVSDKTSKRLAKATFTVRRAVPLYDHHRWRFTQMVSLDDPTGDFMRLGVSAQWFGNHRLRLAERIKPTLEPANV